MMARDGQVPLEVTAWALAVTSAKRSAQLPDVPTLAEALDGAALVQENGPERIEVKRELFAAMDAAAAPGKARGRRRDQTLIV